MTKLHRRIRAPFERGAIHLAMAVIPRLPRKGILFLAQAGGWLGYYLDSKSRKIGLANLDIAFGESKTLSEKRKILKLSQITMARTLMDTFWFAHNPGGRLERYVELDESSRLLLNDKPQICITAHLGNWEILGQMFAHKGFTLSSIATPVKNKTVNKYLIRARETTGQKIIPRKGALKKLLTLLKKNGKTAFLADQNTKESEGAVWVDFFGLPARVTGAPALLSARTGSEILFGFGIPQPGGKYKLYIPESISPPTDGDKETLHEITRQITEITEKEIRKHPEYWLWNYKRWRKIDCAENADRYPFYAKL